MKNIIILVVWALLFLSIGSGTTIRLLEKIGNIPTKYETGEIIKHKGRVFMLVEMQTEYRPLIPEEVSR